MGLLIALVLVIVLALFGMKVIPSVMEYRTAKGAIQAVARSGATTPQDVRRAFENRATIDNITSVRPQDLEITRDGNSVAIAFAYRKEIPLVANTGVYIEFKAASKE